MPKFRIRRDKTETIDVEAPTKEEAIRRAEGVNWEHAPTFQSHDAGDEWDAEEIDPVPEPRQPFIVVSIDQEGAEVFFDKVLAINEQHARALVDIARPGGLVDSCWPACEFVAHNARLIDRPADECENSLLRLAEGNGNSHRFRGAFDAPKWPRK